MLILILPLAEVPFSFAKASVFRSLEISSEGLWKFSKEDISFVPEQWNAGARLNLSSFTGIVSLNNKSFLWGAKVSLLNKTLPFKLEVLSGKLTFSQAISRMKNPSLSLPSALHKAPFLTPGISPSLPAFNGSDRDISFAINLSPCGSLHWFPKLESAFSLKGEGYASFFRDFSFSWMPNGSFSFTWASFLLGKKNTDSWYQDFPFFPEKNYGVMESEVNLLFQNFRFSAALGLHEHPFQTAAFWMRAYASFLTEHFTLHTATFLSDKNLICPDLSMPKPYLQFQLNPQIHFSPGTILFESGLLFNADFCKTKKRLSRYYQNYSLRFDTSLTCGRCNFSFFNGVKFSTEDEEVTYTGKLLFSAKNRKLSSKSSLSFSKENYTDTFTFSQSLSPVTKKRVSPAHLKSVSLSEKITFKKENFHSAQTDFSFTLGGSFSKIKWNLKLAAEVCFIPIDKNIRF